MRYGLRTIPYRRGQPLPLEFVAGIAGIVVFMGVIQLAIALIRKLRRRH
jgi:hypothetical protein